MANPDPSNNKKLLGFWDLLSISLGQIVGAGVVIVVAIGISTTGHGTPWAFLMALGIVLLPSLCIAALGAAIPSTGGMYTYVRDLLGPKTAILYLGLLVAGQLVLAVYALEFADYGLELFPGSNSTLVAAIVMTSCYVANLFGIKVAARFQSVMVVVLLISLLAFIAFGLPKVTNLGNFTSFDTVMPNGFAQFLAAAYVLRFSMIGSEFISELGGETRDPGRTIPKVILTSLTIVTVIYVGVALVASGTKSLDQVQGKNLALVAREIFPTAMYIFFVAGGVMLALVTSLNSIFGWCTKGLYMATQDGWLPKSIAITNRFGTPYLLLSVFYIVGMFPIVTGLESDNVTKLGNTVGIIFGIIPVVALFNLYERNPDAYHRASFKLPVMSMKVIPVLAFLIYSYGVYLSRHFIGYRGFAILLIYSLLLVIYAFLREPHASAVQDSKNH